MLRRLYSSVPPGPRAGPSVTTSSRGRTKPQTNTSSKIISSARPSPSIKSPSPASQSAICTIGKGRRRTSRFSKLFGSSATSSKGGIKERFPTSRDYAFQPIPIYPAQMALHQTFLPKHMPIPINLGSSIYNSPTPPPSNHPFGEFGITNSPNPGDILRQEKSKIRGEFSHLFENNSLESENNIMNDHLHVISTLSHPNLVHHLGDPVGLIGRVGATGGGGSASILDMEASENHLVRSLADASIRNRLSASTTWEKTMEKLGLQEKTQKGTKLEATAGDIVQDKQYQVEEIQNAVKGLTNLLAKMEMPSRGRNKDIGVSSNGVEDLAEEDVMWLDSVKRKRKKKISKHKYQKRRKATRAQRKRLGK